MTGRRLDRLEAHLRAGEEAQARRGAVAHLENILRLTGSEAQTAVVMKAFEDFRAGRLTPGEVWETVRHGFRWPVYAAAVTRVIVGQGEPNDAP